ncbi:HK97 family phage prohead protease [Zhengella sp. ZM62]|uniref:HK97 family phage prohead protease n=1 Tax=Zhengella sedimenti TaxID=3390035 RepID=UPI003974D7B6
MQTIDLERKYAPMALQELDADGSFTGYASLFGEVDLGNDLVERGAFSRSLGRRGAAGVRMLFQHDPAQPIGRWTELREDDRGLFVRGRLSASSARAREVLGLMRDGALDGLSIGFRTVRARKGQGGVRRILEADLWEISVVTFPMLPGARIGEIKRAAGLPTMRQFERWLTRDAGLTRAEARTVIVKGFGHLVRERDAARDTPEGLAGAIRRAAATLSMRTRQ